MADRDRDLETRLRDAERRLAETQELTGTGSWELDLATGALWWSDETRRIFEIPEDAPAPSYETFLALVHPDDRALVDGAYTESVASQRPYAVEHRLLMPDGRVKHLRETGRTVYDQGRPVRSFGSVQDVSGLVKAGEALRTSEYRLSQAVHVARLGFFDHDQRADTIYWSPRQREIYGIGPDTPITLADFGRFVHPDDRDWVLATVHRAHDPSGDGVWAVEHRIVRGDGAVRWLVARSQTEFGGEGPARHPVRTVGAVMDITDLHTTDEAMRLRDQALATAVTPIAFTDAAGRLIYVNPAFVRAWGYESEHEILGLLPTDLGDPESTAAVVQQIRERGSFQGELVARRRDGTTFDVLLSAHAVRDAQGHVVNLMGSMLDVSESKHLQARLAQAEKLESIGRLAGGVAHDFNNLLTVIKGFTELTLAGLDAGDPRHETLTHVATAADAASRLTQQLLAFSRKQVISPEVLDLNGVIGALEPLLRSLVGEDLDVQVIQHERPVLVRFDRGQCEQILVNLAANARDAMPHGGRLTIESGLVTLDDDYCRDRPGLSPGEYALLAVSDTGIGLDDDARAHLFEPFFTTKGLGRGTGLGLPMVFGAVAQNDGRLEVYSEVGHGTTFKIYVPTVTGAPAPAAAPGCAAGLDIAAGHGTVLLVEDNPEVRMLATRALARSGYEVLACGSAEEALDALATVEGELALLVTDVVLPGMNGRALAEQVQARRPGVRVLFTSGYTANVIVHHGVLHEGVRFLQKPYALADLCASVREAIEAEG